MKKNLISLPLLIAITAFGQDKARERHPIDIDAIRQTELTGDVGLRPTVMSVPASESETEAFIKKFPSKKYLTFPESRDNSIRLLDGIPEKWLTYRERQLTSYKDKGRPGEYFVFQVGVYASSVPLKNIRISFVSTGTGSELIKGLTCFNSEGTSFRGLNFKKQLNLEHKKVLPLWFGIQLPNEANRLFNGQIIIKPEGLPATSVAVTITIEGSSIENHGYNNEQQLSRLAWLNSRLAIDNDITAGFKQIVRNEKTISILGRTITLSDQGLPANIQTFFDANNQNLLPSGQPLLSRPVTFIVEENNGKLMKFKSGKIKFKDHYPGNTEWETTLSNEQVQIRLSAKAEYDGFIGYSALVTSLKDIAVQDIRLEIPLRPEKAIYMMGLDKEGGFSPKEWQWKWDVINKNQDEVWMGAVNGGLKLKLKGKNYHRQLINIYYPFGPLNEPESWGNNKKGGVDIRNNDKYTLIKAFSGNRTLLKGQTYQFDFDLLVTPFKLINKDIQFNDRYYHSDIDTSLNFIKTASEHGANIINVHHKKDIYPFINYPYIAENIPDLKAFIDSSHIKHLKTKLYYTTRELTVNAPEIWAMRALNNEILYPGPGMATRTLVNPNGVHPWLGENFKEDFIPAWVATFTHGKYKGRQDLAVLTTPDSRLNNFYVEGLDWMCKNLQIDGIYIDDLALDRETMRRTRKVLDRERPGARIDMHTWNHYNQYAKWASSLNLYMDLLPYIDQLWVGEARDYDRSPDYWLIETSGIPFGLTSQMLNKGGNKWRGMVFGITNRFGWHSAPTPGYIWGFWDAYNIEKKQMIGFWDNSIPVRSDNPDTKATIYTEKDEVIIALANWTDKPQKCRLEINWKALNLSPDDVTTEVPYIKEYQEGGKIDILNEIDLEGEKGLLIVLKRK